MSQPTADQPASTVLEYAKSSRGGRVWRWVRPGSVGFFGMVLMLAGLATWGGWKWKLRADENALWSLGAHDVSVLLALAGEEPCEVVAHGASYVRAGVQDVVFCFMRFPSGLSAHLHLSWLDPHKERRFTVVGSRRMATFDDMALERKLTVYDKGFDEDARGYGEYITRSGDIFSPRIPNLEPLRVECEHFVESIRRSEPPRSDGASGLRVVRVLEQLQRSLDTSGRAARRGAEVGVSGG